MSVLNHININGTVHDLGAKVIRLTLGDFMDATGNEAFINGGIAYFLDSEDYSRIILTYNSVEEVWHGSYTSMSQSGIITVESITISYDEASYLFRSTDDEEPSSEIDLTINDLSSMVMVIW